MRLTPNQAATIRRIAKEMFPADVRIGLFGSLVHNAAKGGDIDLLVETDTALDNPVSLACRYTARLQQTLGDQPLLPTRGQNIRLSTISPDKPGCVYEPIISANTSAPAPSACGRKGKLASAAN